MQYGYLQTIKVKLRLRIRWASFVLHSDLFIYLIIERDYNQYCFFKRSVCSLVIHQHILSLSSLKCSLSITLHKEHWVRQAAPLLANTWCWSNNDEGGRWMELMWDDDGHVHWVTGCYWHILGILLLTCSQIYIWIFTLFQPQISNLRIVWDIVNS